MSVSIADFGLQLDTRRAHYQKRVLMLMGGCVLVLLIGLLRVGISSLAGSGDASASVAATTAGAEVSHDIAASRPKRAAPAERAVVAPAEPKTQLLKAPPKKTAGRRGA